MWLGRHGGWVCSDATQGVVPIHSLSQPVEIPCPPVYLRHSAKDTTSMRDTQPKGAHFRGSDCCVTLGMLQENIKVQTLGHLTSEKSDSIGY